MNIQPEEQFTAAADTDEAVRDYLAEHPDFFERHSGLLRALRLPHVTGGTVSLVERQVSALRQRDSKLERRLSDLVEVARANDQLGKKIHALSIRLLATRSLDETIAVCESTLRTAFDAEQSVLVIFRDAALFKDINVGRFVRPCDRESEELKAFDAILGRSSPRCGQIRDSQRDFLFGVDTDEIGSCALVPLGEHCDIGFLAIGSVDVNRFNPAMSIDFVARLGELVAAALSRY